MKKIISASLMLLCLLAPLQVHVEQVQAQDNIIQGIKDQYNPDENSNPFNRDLVGEVGDGLPGQVSTFDTTRHPLERVNDIIQVLLSFLGIGAIALVTYAGFRWMTAAGNDDAVTEAKKTLRNAVIGLILIIMSYSLSVFIARIIQRETGSYGVGGGLFSGQATIGDGVSGSFGTGVDTD